MNLSAGIVIAGMSGELLSVCLCVSVNMRHFIFCRPLHVRKDQHVAGLAKHPGWGNLKPKVYQDACALHATAKLCLLRWIKAVRDPSLTTSQQLPDI